jgi:hypothetical protein
MSIDLLSARILVDDDEAILQLCRTILQCQGYRNIETIADPRGVMSHLSRINPT